MKKTGSRKMLRRINAGLDAHQQKLMNEDVILEILVRLPPISVVRFKLVSKSWYALISDLNFLERHSLHYHRYIQETSRPIDGRLCCFGQYFIGGGPRRHHYPVEQYQPPDDEIQNHPPPPPPPPPPILEILKGDQYPLDFFSIPCPIFKSNNNDAMSKFRFLFTMASFCNGLVIFHDHGIDVTTDPRFQRKHSWKNRMHIRHSIDSTYFLCNPVLKQYIELPRINLIPTIQNENVPLHKYLYDDEDEEEGEYDLIMSLEPAYYYGPTIVFDPTVSLSYKVIRFILRRYTNHDADPNNFLLKLYAHSDTVLQIYVYSQPSASPSSSSSSSSSSSEITGSTLSWRLITSFPWDDTSATRHNYQVFLNGIMYSLCHKTKAILCFHVVKEIVWFLKCPPLPMGMSFHTYHYFGECGGHLQLVADYYNVNNRHTWFTFPCSFDVLEMEQQQQHYNDQEVIHSAVWTLKYRVNNIQPQPCYDHIRERRILIMRLYKTGRKGEEDEEALLMKLFSRDGKNETMLIFNLTSNTFGKLLDIHIPFGSVPGSYRDVFPCTMTLFPLSSSSSS